MANVTVIGAGNTGVAVAVHLARTGHRPLLYARNPATLTALQSGPVSVEGIWQGSYAIPATGDLDEAVDQADFILVCTWANDHASVFDALYGTAGDKAVDLVVLNGNWGAVQAFDSRSRHAKGTGAGLVGETTGMPYVAHYDRHANRVQVDAMKTRVALSIIPDSDATTARSLFDSLYNEIIVSFNAFGTSLGALNPIIHAPLCLLNMTRIEQGEPFHILTDGFTANAERLISGIDSERHAIARSLDTPYTPILEQLTSQWDEHYDSLHDLFRSNPVYANLSGPDGTGHRFIQEDIPYGITPIVDLGKLLHVPTPVCTALLESYRQYFGTKFNGPAFTNDLIRELPRA